jgi:hypothetical protein
MTLTKQVTLNTDQRLYVIPATHGGYSCLGFDVCKERTEGYANWLGEALPVPMPYASLDAYKLYMEMLSKVSARNRKTGERCPTELTPELIGLENRRVEVVDCYGETRRFWVGKSMGFVPIHLEIARKNSSGGPAVTGAPFKSVKVIGRSR